jgi:hypothetical protein
MAEEQKGIVTINDVSFTPVPGIKYKHDYVRSAALINTPSQWHQLKPLLPPDYPIESLTAEFVQGLVYRNLILNDLWFIVYFVIGVPSANHPFWVKMCKMIETGPRSKTLDVWSRYHGKSSCITIAETVQYHLKHPEECTAIFSFKRPAAEDFLDSVRKTFEKPIIKFAFPDVVYDNPQTQAASWSLQNGITLRRKNTSRKEATVEASGLVEGMATGKHFERRIYDDIETADVAHSIEEMDKCFSRFEMSSYLGTGQDSDIEKVIGTFYSHSGPLVRIMEKQKTDGTPAYISRIIPGTHDGTANGKPVLMSEAKLEEEKTKEHFNSQILCDPTPKDSRKLNPEYLTDIDPEMIPRGCIRLLIVDPAGDDKGKKGDSWSIILYDIDPKPDEMGASTIYISKAIISPLSESEAPEEIARMYLAGGIIQAVGVEKVALSTTEIHVANALAARGRRVSVDEGTLVILRPAGREKKTRILNAVSWPLNNNKIFVSKSVPSAYRDRMRLEMTRFPYYHDDFLDNLAYLYDMIRDLKLNRYSVANQYDYSSQKVYAAGI